MADGARIIIGQANTASNPGSETSLSRNETNPNTVFVARNLNAGNGIHGEASGSNIGVSGYNDNSVSSVGVQGFSPSGFGVQGFSPSGFGVFGNSVSSAGVRGISTNSVGVHGTGRGRNGHGGVFDGGILVVNGAKNFKIDHPLDPENKYLSHVCVESSEMKNIYDGVARLDKEGAAWVGLPEWFEALNGDYRYQLTPIGGSALGLHVAEEISENRFKIAGGEEGMKVCWQVTGSRKDRWAAANPFEVAQEKPEEERGRYLEPGLYDAPEEQRVMIGPVAEKLRAASTPRQGKKRWKSSDGR